mgnify:CR=1 FL=1
MEFNVIDENNKFKIGNIITIFKLPNYKEEFALFSVSDYEEDEASLHVAYLIKDNNGYDYIEEITDSKVLKDTTEAVKEIMKNINKN